MMTKNIQRRRFISATVGCLAAWKACAIAGIEQTTMTTEEVLARLARHPRDGGLLLQLRQAISVETDAAILPRAIAIFSLGSMTMGREEAAGSARDVLLSRYPESEYARIMRMENISSGCNVCAGEGRVASVCPECSGNGRCSMCGGSGSVRNHWQTADMSCPKCAGAGLCVSCRGEGRRFRSCRRCNGQGVVVDSNKVREVYDMALRGDLDTGHMRDDPQDIEEYESREREAVPEPDADPSTWDEDVIRFF